MGCRSDYMEPTERELESIRVCGLLKYVIESTKLQIPKIDRIKAVASSPYGNIASLDDDTALLCELIRNFTKDEMNSIVYDGRNSNARKLAEWWDAHQAADDRRKAEDDRRKAEEKIRAYSY